MSRLPSCGLYVITADAICSDVAMLLGSVTAALRGGAVMVQYRDKRNPLATRQHYARQLQALCREAGVPLILNDGPAEQVIALGLDGMHLGLADGDLAAARHSAPQALLGATCGATLERAEAAVRAGADYLAFGAFYPSTTKPQAPRATPALLREARAQYQLPLCAIGGITPENAAPLIAAGADYIAAIGGVFDAPDIEAAASRYARLFTR